MIAIIDGRLLLIVPLILQSDNPMDPKTTGKRILQSCAFFDGREAHVPT